MDNMSRFTAGAQEAVNQAAQFASSMGENYVGTEHLLLGLVLEGGTAAEILRKQGIDADKAAEYIRSVSTDGGYGNPQAVSYTHLDVYKRQIPLPGRHGKAACVGSFRVRW